MHDPENELYDHACDLVEAAAAIRRAMRPEASAAVPALLGCLEVGLADLRLMASALPESLDAGPNGDRDRVERGLVDLAAALREAEAAAAVARLLVASSRSAAGRRCSSGRRSGPRSAP